MDDELKQFLSDMKARVTEEIHLLHTEVRALSNAVDGLQLKVGGFKQQLDSLEQRISSLEKTALGLVTKVSSTVPENLTTVKLLERSINPVRIPMALSTKNSLDRHRRVMEKLRKTFDV